MNRDDSASVPASTRPVANPRRTRLADVIPAAAGAPAGDAHDEVETGPAA